MFKFELDTTAAMENNFGGKGFKTGTTLAKVLNIFPGQSTGGNNIVDIEIENEQGGRAFIFGLKTDKVTKTGAKNYDYAKWMEFAVICGLRTGEEGIAERKVNGVMKQVPTLAEGKNKKLNITLQQTFGVNNKTNKETIMWSLVKTFTPEGKSLKETQENLPATEMDAFVAKDYYSKEWISANEDGTLIKDTGTSTSSATADATPAAEAAPTGKLF